MGELYTMIGESDTRPWGSWHILDEGDGFKVKRLEVLPHSRLSYQTHAHRSEHWVVVTGRASSVIDGETVISEPGECVDIPIGMPHRIVNDEDELLVIVEVQRGDYCGEDDIVRLEDDYGRQG
ncbi:phosphomannose isomerase type II C-terminal cupin domain [Nocardioides sp. BP30]|uniref:phosphomannose isomerase type II C-terminal cupin domain n=1 Tax=Nocardioides sp. BP30 TaxID=3036374 RepID=UPI00246919DC|nr:phosphomannose isomerase type II C-terminal cupin domain [Nocardioides sp. BP30]WGL53072.1 phosphomannose isomerase type II C-terminal cupin domain [Nocardioides sp. BP30]